MRKGDVGKKRKQSRKVGEPVLPSVQLNIEEKTNEYQ
jgi:hypothetical protein